MGSAHWESSVSSNSLRPLRRLQADHVAQQGAFAAAAAAHDDEDVPPVDREREIPLDDKTAVRHGQVANDDVRRFVIHTGVFSCRPFGLKWWSGNPKFEYRNSKQFLNFKNIMTKTVLAMI
jgi:hypothetical protein